MNTVSLTTEQKLDQLSSIVSEIEMDFITPYQYNTKEMLYEIRRNIADLRFCAHLKEQDQS